MIFQYPSKKEETKGLKRLEGFTNGRYLIFIVVLVMLTSFAWADSNGVWHEAKDVKPGIFGADENPGNFTFNDTVEFASNGRIDMNGNNINNIGRIGSVDSTAVVGNLNADMVDGKDGSELSGLWNQNGGDIYNKGNVGIGPLSQLEDMLNGLSHSNHKLSVAGSGRFIGDSSDGVTGMVVRNLDKDAFVQVSSGNSVTDHSGSGDVKIAANIVDEQDWIMGIDNSDNNKFKISPYWSFDRGSALEIGSYSMQFNRDLEVNGHIDTSSGYIEMDDTLDLNGNAIGNVDGLWVNNINKRVDDTHINIKDMLDLNGNHIGGVDTLWINGRVDMRGNDIEGVGDLTYASDKRLKDNIKVLDNSLESIQRIKGVSFKWKNSSTNSIGLIAQEVEKVYPELVYTDNETGMKSLAYSKMVAPLLEATKKQQEVIEQQNARIEQQDAKIRELTSIICSEFPEKEACNNKSEK